MNNILKGLLAIYFATVTNGNICCVPTKWEGNMYGSGDLLSGTTSIETERAFYDADGKKIVLLGVAVKNGRRTKIWIIDNRNTRMRYIIEPDKQACLKVKIGSEFPELCIPDGSKSIGSSYVGIGGNRLHVTSYTFHFKKALFDLNTTMVVTDDGCIPVSSVARGTNNKASYFEILNYLNITTGIKNDNIFNPPDYCDQATPDLVDHKDLQEYSIFKF